MSKIRRIVLDVMKPFEPDIITYADNLADIEGVNAVNIVLVEADREVENIKITIEGGSLDWGLIKDKIVDLAGAIHSIDEVVAGKKIIEMATTPQDHHHS